MDAAMPTTNGMEAYGEVVWSWRLDAGVKFAVAHRSKWIERGIPPATVARKPVHRGEREISRKPLRRESRIASAGPVCSCALCFVHFAHETAGAARTRSSLRPCVPEICQNVTTGGSHQPPVAGTEPVAPKGDRACNRARDSSGVFLNPNSCKGFEPVPGKEGSG